jgi:uncharacterized heparinase superfamily protein
VCRTIVCRTMQQGRMAISGGILAQRARLWWFAASRGLLTVLARVNALPLVRWASLPITADRLLIAPQDLRTADPTRASELYAGRFAFAGKIVICDGRSPFQMEPPSLEWADILLGFGWLRHLRAAENNLARANARALVADWMARQGAWNGLGWRPEIVARRIISWLCQAPLVLQETDVTFYRRFLRNLTRQVRYLRRTVSSTRDGLPRLQAIIALTYASLCMEGQARWLKPLSKRLVDELERQVLPDGGHISRNPGALIELLLDLLPLKQAFAHRNVAPPSALLNAIDRMMPMLRFFRHGDGNFALFNGMGPTAPELLATVLAYDDARGAPLANAPHSGYQRLQANGLLVIIDTGRPPPLTVSQQAHAGCLAFEVSSKQNRIVVNCGLPAISRDSWRPVARATPAHSTVSFNGESSAQFAVSSAFRRLFGAPLYSGPTEVPVNRQDRDHALVVRASHDGYAGRFGVLHQRSLRLAADGNRFDGEDVFAPAAGDAIPSHRRDEFAVRFHLHPSVRVNRLADGHGVMLLLPNQELWTFSAYEDQAELEESVYLAGPEGPRRAVQIVIYGRARAVSRVRWTFAQADSESQAPAPDAIPEIDPMA